MLFKLKTMTKDELIKKLEPFPGDMDVMFAEIETGFKYVPVNSVRRQTLRFTEDPDADADYEGPEAFEDCIILDEDY